MKQHITAEDLQSLTDEQKERLREWWGPKDGDWFYGTHGGGRNYSYCGPEQYVWVLSPYEVDGGVYGASLSESPPDEGALPLLSIGQCIELLGKIEVRGLMAVRRSTNMKWYYMAEFPLENIERFRDFPELADALWQAIKEAL